MEDRIMALVSAYEKSRGSLDQVNQELADLLRQLPISSYGQLVVYFQQQDESWWKGEVHWHTPDGPVYHISVEAMCSHGDEWQEQSSCQWCSQNEAPPRFTGDLSEAFLSGIIREFSEMVGKLKNTITQRNNLARALRSALANKS